MHVGGNYFRRRREEDILRGRRTRGPTRPRCEEEQEESRRENRAQWRGEARGEPELFARYAKFIGSDNSGKE